MRVAELVVAVESTSAGGHEYAIEAGKVAIGRPPERSHPRSVTTSDWPWHRERSL